MAHPPRFDDDDPLLARVSELALSLPDARVKVSHGRPAFFTTRVFCWFGGAERVAGAWVDHPRCVLVSTDQVDRAALLEERERVFVPAYLGPAGWLGVELPPLRASSARWREVAELVDASYRRTAGVRRVTRLDARASEAAGGPTGRRA